MGPGGEERRAEQQEGQDARHHDEGEAGVGRLGTPEARDPVRDRLEPGERRAAVGVGPQQREEGQAHQDAAALGAEPVVDELGGRWLGHEVERPGDLLADPDQDRQAQHGDEEVGRDGEERTGLSDAAEVAVDQEQDHADGDRHGEGDQARKGAGQRGGAGRALHGHRHDVVDHQGHRRHLGDTRPEVVPGHDVGASGRRVVLDHVEVGAGDQEEHPDDHEHDRHDHGERGEADVGRQLGEDLLGAIGRRRDAVGGEHAEGGEAVEPLAPELLGDVGPAEHEPLEPVAERLGVDRADVGVRGHDPRRVG